MVSGEGVSVAVKNKTAISRIWKVPGMLCGNILPRWMDPGGAISRRVILLGFENYVIHSDPLLAKRLIEESAALLCKCNRAYLWGVAHFKKFNIWDALPEYFKKKQNELIESSNQLVNFLNNCADLDKRPEAFMLEDEFIRSLNRFMKEKSLGKFIWKNEYFGQVFARQGLKLERSVKRYNGQDVHGCWIVGVGERPDSINKIGGFQNQPHQQPPMVPTPMLH